MSFDPQILAVAKEVFGNVPLGDKIRLINCGITRTMADDLAKEKKYKDACVNYIKAAAQMLGRDLPIQPNGPFHLPEYQQLEPGMAMFDMMQCLNGAADCLVMLRQYKQVSALLLIVIFQRSN
jgi:hypothetical protein